MIYIILMALCVIIILQYLQGIKTKRELQNITKILEEVVNGDLDRRLLVDERSILSDLVYKINDIVINNKQERYKHVQSEKTINS